MFQHAALQVPLRVRGLLFPTATHMQPVSYNHMAGQRFSTSVWNVLLVLMNPSTGVSHPEKTATVPCLLVNEFSWCISIHFYMTDSKLELVLGFD